MRLIEQGTKVFWMLAALLVLCCPQEAAAVGEASTRFNIFVPPNNVGPNVALIITAADAPYGGTTTVDLVDDDGDGDNDDTMTGLSLARGQSYIRYIMSGAVNDDAGGKWDGDFFHITSNFPVTAQVSNNSDWQHDWVPADNKRMIGRNFYIYTPLSSNSDRDVNVYAYSDDTDVAIMDITTTPKTSTGYTQVSFDTASTILAITLNEGEDLIVRNGLGLDMLDSGHTYYIQATRPVTVEYGALGVTNGGNSARDGGGFVPSRNGSSTGTDFYFFIAHNPSHEDEKELRVVAFNDGTSITLQGWNATSEAYETISTYNVDALEHLDVVGATDSGFRDHELYRLTTNGQPVAVFEANWLETGSPGTSDFASFVSSEDGSGAGLDFLAYVGPPGDQSHVAGIGGLYTHVFIFSHVAGTELTLTDADTGGSLLYQTASLAGADSYYDLMIDTDTYNLLNRSAEGVRPYIRVQSNYLVSVMSTNWNDNWMNFVASVLLPNPDVDIESSTRAPSCDESFTLSFSADNISDLALGDPTAYLVLPAGIEYGYATTGDLGSPTVSSGAGGETQLAWSGFALSAGTLVNQEVSVTLDCSDPDLPAVVNGYVVNPRVVVEGDQGGESYITQDSTGLRLVDPSGTEVTGLSTVSGDGVVTVDWCTAREVNNSYFEILRADSADGVYTSLGTVPSQGEAPPELCYEFDDDTVVNDVDWFYKVVAVNTNENEAVFGPVQAHPEDRTPPGTPSLSGEAGDGTATLTVSGGDEGGDLDGYHIERSLNPEGPFIRITYAPIDGPTYVQSNLTNETTYYYRAVAVDNVGNESDPSNVVALTPHAPSLVETDWVLAFEDMKGPGGNDWDYNDFVVKSHVAEHFVASGLSLVVVTYEALARGAGYIHQFRLAMDLNGASTVTVQIYADRNAETPLSTSYHFLSGRVDTVVFSDTRDALPPPGAEFPTNTEADQGATMLGRVAVVTIEVNDPASNPSVGRHAAPYDPYLYLPYLDGDAEIHRFDEGYADGQEVEETYADGPLYGYSLSFVLVVQGTAWEWPKESVPLWLAYPDFSPYIIGGKTDHLTWDESPTTSFTYQLSQ